MRRTVARHTAVSPPGFRVTSRAARPRTDLEGTSFRETPTSATLPALQTKLSVGGVNDSFEREADQVAEQVMRMPTPSLRRKCGTCQEEEEKSLRRTPVQRLQRKCAKCQEEEEILRRSTAPAIVQRTETAPASHVAEAPPLVHEVLRGGGAPLDRATRAFMEPRFGHDFGNVRIHTDERAAESARSVDALAYTVGSNIVFGSGRYAPGSSEGRRLLAHELTHTVQQGAVTPDSLQRTMNSSEASTLNVPGALAAHDQKPIHAVRQSGAGRLQRQPAPGRKRADVVILMADGLEAEAATLAPGATVLKVSTPEEMATKLKAVTAPIGTLFIISHSLPSGDLGFESGNTTTYVDPTKLATTITGSVPADKAPELIDFRGCSIGTSPQGMDKLRKAVGAKAAVGGNCFNITWIQGPVALSGKKITKASQVTKANRADFERGLQMLIDLFGKAKGCILDRSETAYFRAGGKMVAQWYTPSYDTNWDERKSRCLNSLTPEKVNPASKEDFSPGLAGQCRRLRVENTP